MPEYRHLLLAAESSNALPVKCVNECWQSETGNWRASVMKDDSRLLALLVQKLKKLDYYNQCRPRPQFAEKWFASIWHRKRSILGETAPNHCFLHKNTFSSLLCIKHRPTIKTMFNLCLHSRLCTECHSRVCYWVLEYEWDKEIWKPHRSQWSINARQCRHSTQQSKAQETSAWMNKCLRDA